jgi:hypothetical protein
MGHAPEWTARHFQILGYVDGDGSAVDTHEDPQFWLPAKLGNVPCEFHSSLAVGTLRLIFVGFHIRAAGQLKEAPTFLLPWLGCDEAWRVRIKCPA